MARQRSGPRRRGSIRAETFKNKIRPIGKKRLDPFTDSEDEPFLRLSPESIKSSIEQAIHDGEYNKNQLEALSQIEIPGVETIGRGAFDREALEELAAAPPTDLSVTGPLSPATDGLLVPPEARQRVVTDPIALPTEQSLLRSIAERHDGQAEIEALLRGEMDPHLERNGTPIELMPTGTVPLSDLSLEAAARNIDSKRRPAAQAKNAVDPHTISPKDLRTAARDLHNEIRDSAPAHHVNIPDPALDEIAAREDLRNEMTRHISADRARQASKNVSAFLRNEGFTAPGDQSKTDLARAALNRINAAPFTVDPVTDRAIQLAQGQTQAPVGASNPFDSPTVRQQIIADTLARLGSGAASHSSSEDSRVDSNESRPNQFARASSIPAGFRNLTTPDVLHRHLSATPLASGLQRHSPNGGFRALSNNKKNRHGEVLDGTSVTAELSNFQENNDEFVEVAQLYDWEVMESNAEALRRRRPEKDDPHQRRIKLPELGIEVRGPLDNSDTRIDVVAESFRMIVPAIYASGDKALIDAWEVILSANDIVVVNYDKYTGGAQANADTETHGDERGQVTFYPKGFRKEDGSERTQCEIATTALHEVLHHVPEHRTQVKLLLERLNRPSTTDEKIRAAAEYQDYERGLTKIAADYLDEWGICPKE